MWMFVEFGSFRYEGEWECRLWAHFVLMGTKQISLELSLKYGHAAFIMAEAIHLGLPAECMNARKVVLAGVGTLPLLR